MHYKNGKIVPPFPCHMGVSIDDLLLTDEEKAKKYPKQDPTKDPALPPIILPYQLPDDRYYAILHMVQNRNKNQRTGKNL